MNFLTGSTDKPNGEIKIGNNSVSSFISRIKKIQPDHTDEDTIGFLPAFRTESSTHTQSLSDTAISAHAKTAEEAEKTKIEMRDLNPTSFNKSGSLERSPPVRACLPLAQKNAFSIASPQPLSQFQMGPQSAKSLFRLSSSHEFSSPSAGVRRVGAAPQGSARATPRALGQVRSACCGGEDPFYRFVREPTELPSALACCLVNPLLYSAFPS